MAGQVQCVLALCLLGALLFASPATAEQKSDEKPSSLMHGTTLNHRRALRLVIESTTGYWFWDTRAQTKVTLVPAKSLKKKPAAPAELKLVEKQLSTAHLKDVDLPEWYKHKFGAKGESVAVVVTETKSDNADDDDKAEAGR